MFTIREAVEADSSAIFAIWKRGLALSLGFEADQSIDAQYFQRAIESQDSTFKVWVAEDEYGRIIGWQSLMPTRNNPVMRNLVAESSTYCDQSDIHHGIGSRLMATATKHADNCALQYIIGTISEGNQAMRRIVEKAGWKEVGRIPGSKKPPACPDAVFAVYIAKEGEESQS